MAKGPLILGAIGAAIALIVLFPFAGCGSDDGGIPDRGPDPNAASCSSLVFDAPSWGRTSGGEPGTGEEFTSAQLVWRRMWTRAVGVAFVPLGAGLFASWMIGRSRRVR